MIKELECVALNVALPEHGLAAGDVGAVVHAYKDGHGFMVEFTTFDGKTVALTRVSADQIRRSRPTKFITPARSIWPAGMGFLSNLRQNDYRVYYMRGSPKCAVDSRDTRT